MRIAKNIVNFKNLCKNTFILNNKANTALKLCTKFEGIKSFYSTPGE